MTDLLLTSEEVARVRGISAKTVRAWVHRGYLVPAIDGRGKGHSHRFNPQTMYPDDSPKRPKPRRRTQEKE